MGPGPRWASQLLEDTSQHIKAVQNALKSMETETEVLTEAKKIRVQELRIRENLVKTLRHKFADAVDSFKGLALHAARKLLNIYSSPTRTHLG